MNFEKHLDLKIKLAKAEIYVITDRNCDIRFFEYDFDYPKGDCIEDRGYTSGKFIGVLSFRGHCFHPYNKETNTIDIEMTHGTRYTKNIKEIKEINE